MPPNYQPQPPTTMRPPNPRRRMSDTPDMMPDLILEMPDLVEAKNITYLCYRYPAEKKITNCWKIARIATEFNGPIEVVTMKYPFGCSGYNFNPKHIEMLHYEYPALDWKFDYEW